MSAAIAASEPLVVMRVKAWRFSLCLKDVEQVLSAALPVALPSARGTRSAIRLGESLVPLVYTAALFGEREITLRAEDKLVIARAPSGQLALWVEAVEDVVPFVTMGSYPAAGLKPLEFLAAMSGGEQSLPVLDLPGLHATLAAG